MADNREKPQIGIGELCPRGRNCCLNGPNVTCKPVAASKKQLWSVFYCKVCYQKGLCAASVEHPILSLFSWNEVSPAAKYWFRKWQGWDR